MTTSITVSDQDLMDHPEARRHLAMKMFDLGVQQEDRLQEKLDEARQVNTSLVSEIDQLQERINNEVVMEKRIKELTQKLVECAASLGAPLQENDKEGCDAGIKFQKTLNHFLKQFSIQGTGPVDTMARMLTLLRVVETLEVGTRVEERVPALPPLPPGGTSTCESGAKEVEGSNQQQSESSVAPSDGNGEQPIASTSGTVNQGMEPTRKRRKEESTSENGDEDTPMWPSTSPPEPGKIVKQEPGVFDHRRHPSREFRGKFACLCGVVFYGEKSLMTHIRYYAGPLTIKCPFTNPDVDGLPCLQIFPNASRLTKHFHRFHGQRDVTFKLCGYCREAIQIGNGRMDKHHKEMHNIDLTDDDNDDDGPSDEMKNQDLSDAESTGSNEESFAGGYFMEED